MYNVHCTLYNVHFDKNTQNKWVGGALREGNMTRSERWGNTTWQIWQLAKYFFKFFIVFEFFLRSRFLEPSDVVNQSGEIGRSLRRLGNWQLGNPGICYQFEPFFLAFKITTILICPYSKLVVVAVTAVDDLSDVRIWTVGGNLGGEVTGFEHHFTLNPRCHNWDISKWSIPAWIGKDQM